MQKQLPPLRCLTSSEVALRVGKPVTSIVTLARRNKIPSAPKYGNLRGGGSLGLMWSPQAVIEVEQYLAERSGS